MIDVMFSPACVRVLGYSTLISALRWSSSLLLSDLVGGLFITSPERLGKYWRESSAFEDFALGEPGVREAVLLHRAGNLETRVIQEGLGPAGQNFSYSSDLEAIFTRAQELALSRKDVQSGTKPFVIPEDLLLALAQLGEAPIVRRLVSSGLDLKRLEEAVKTTKDLGPLESPSQ